MKTLRNGRRPAMIAGLLAPAVVAMAIAGTAYAGSDWLTGSTDEKLTSLAEIQPGLGTIMIEYSSRFTNLYYAAKGGNWKLAGYQLKEALEIQEVGEMTRPKRAKGLKKFEEESLGALSAAIEAKDATAFEAAFTGAVKGCNACHSDEGFDFIVYQLPEAPTSPLKNTP
jgi:hypothetical protein